MITTINEFKLILENTQNDLYIQFIDHFINNTPININNIPNKLINKLPDYIDINDKFYSGNNSNTKIENIKYWTTDIETAHAFSLKYKNRIVFKLDYDEFTKIFDFISMDVLNNYLISLNYDTSKYYSESEIVAFKK